MNELKRIHDKKYKNILLDIFDTVVYRNVDPEYTKKIWAGQIVKLFNLKGSMIDLYQWRFEAERKLGEKSHNEGNDWEFKYDDLINLLYDEVISRNCKISKKKFKEISTEIEISIESSVQKPNSDIIKEIKAAKKEGKKIYCVSDMYLTKNMLEEIFSRIGIGNLFDNIFVSCEYLKNKKSGLLYDIVLKTLNIKSESCLMIGDNESSDYINPKDKGIESVLLNRQSQYKKYEEFRNSHSVDSFEKQILNLSSSTCDNFEHAIFSLYQFTEKLYYQLLDDGLDEVFFLSREGEFLKKLFDEYNNSIYGKKIKSYYILVSRKSTYLPSLKTLKKEDFGGLLKQYLNSSISEFLGSLNFTKEERTTILKSFKNDCKTIDKNRLSKFDKEGLEAILNGDYNHKIVYLYGSKLLVQLKKNKDFQIIYEKNRTEQNKLFKKYIKQNTNKKNICVVDIGWNGSIQDNIQNILGNDYKVTGYLFGLISRDPEKCKNKQGLIFSNVPKYTSNYTLFGENRSIYEILLGASHGSANKYIEKNGKIEVSTFEKKEEKDIYNNVISKIQKDMFKIYTEMEKTLINNYYDNKKIDKIINRIHYKMVFKPSEKQLTFFNKIYHYENFGVFEFSKFNLNKELNLAFYIKENAKYVLKRKSFFNDAFWPTLKLYNEKLFIPIKLYEIRNRIRLKRKGVI